jgi:hypothetical protein
MLRTLCATVGLVAVSLTAPLHSQASDEPSSPAPDAPDVGDEVVVRGRRMSDIEDGLRVEIGKFIDEITVTFGGRGFARWDRSVCVGVHNLEATAAQYLVDRISLLAHEVGLTPDEPGCAPQVIIIFTTDGGEVARQLVENEPKLFRPTVYLGTNRGLAALDEFVESEKAIRWWQVSLPVDARTGMPAIDGLEGRRCTSPLCAPNVNVAGPSRIHSGIRDVLRNVVVIVDSTKLTGTTWQQLGDYLAVVSLAQVDLAANPAAFDSILNLFTNPKAYSGLTDWDRTYVQALYQFDQERNVKLQQGALTGAMLRTELERQFGPEGGE